MLASFPRARAAQLEEDARRAGANAVLRRPLDRRDARSRWLAKLLIVPRRVEARVPVQGQVVGTLPHTRGRRTSSASPTTSASTACSWPARVRLADEPDLDLEFVLPGVRARLRALGRVVREAPEVAWPYRGYGVEFLFVPAGEPEALDPRSCAGRCGRRRCRRRAGPQPRHPLHAAPGGLGLRDPRARAAASRAGRRRSGARRASAGGRASPDPSSSWKRRSARKRPARGPGLRRPRTASERLPRVSVLLPVRDAAATLRGVPGLAGRADASPTTRSWRSTTARRTGAAQLLEAAARGDDPRVRVVRQSRRAGWWPRSTPPGARRALRSSRAWTRTTSATPSGCAPAGRVPRRPTRTSAVLGHRRAARGPRSRNDGHAGLRGWLNGLLDHEAIVRDLFVESPLAHPSRDAAGRASLRALGRLPRVRRARGLRPLAARARGGRAVRASCRRCCSTGATRPSRLSRTDPPLRARALPRAEDRALERGPLARGRAVVCGARAPSARAGRGPCARAAIAWPRSSRSHPRRLGQRIHGAPVVPVSEAAVIAGALHLAAVGQPGAREEIRRQAARLGLRDGADLIAVA